MKKYLPFILLLIGIHLLLLMNLRFTAWPEMVSFPFLSNNGYILYKDMIHAYPPVLTIILGVMYKIFGYKLIVLKIITWLIIILNDVLIVKITQKISGSSLWSLISLIFYVFTQPFLEGNMLWYDLAIVPAILFAFLSILNRKYFIAGFFFAVAALAKQNAALFLIFSIFYVLYRERSIKKLAVFLIGPLLLIATFITKLIADSSLMDFLNWTLIYPAKYWTNFPGYVQMGLSHRQLLIFIALCLPAFFVFLRRKHLLLILYFMLSCVLIYPRFSFFHFQAGIAFSAILFGIFINKSKTKLMLITPLFICLFVVASFPVLKTDWQKESRFWGSEEIKTAKLINNSTKDGDLLYFFGPHSAIYVFANRLPPKPWVDNYSWYFEIPGVQEDIIKKWNTNMPSYIFAVRQEDGNWFDLGTYRPSKIMDWVKEEKIQVVEIE